MINKSDDIDVKLFTELNSGFFGVTRIERDMLIFIRDMKPFRFIGFYIG